jgi:3-phenylpropionate/trans-cinnamate dioxygenase ferredoxin reductase component
VKEPACTLVVGAGLAGSRCAETLRAEGYSGRIVVVGDEPHPPYERPALSKELLAGTRTDLELRPRSFWDEREIELRLGTRVLDLGLRGRMAETSAGRIRWDALVLATGARARRLLTLPDRPGFHSLRTRADADLLRCRLAPGVRLAVVGAGFVGTEVASSAAALGVQVTLIEAGRVPFERLLGREVGLLLSDRYRAHGVEVRVDAGVERVGTGLGGKQHSLRLSDGAEIACDIALFAVGSEPAGDLLGPTAVLTDACGRTNLPGVHACGDVAAWWRPSLGRHVRSEHWTGAAAQGATVARTLVGRGQPLDQPGYFWSDQFGLRLQHVGGDESWAEIKLDGTPDAFTARYVGADGRLVAALLANRPQHAASLRREIAQSRMTRTSIAA